MKTVADPRKTMSGREVLEARLQGDVRSPPLGVTLGLQLVQVGEGIATFECAITDKVLNFQGTVHGGLSMTLIDSACACAAYTLCSAGQVVTTIETKVNFTKPAPASVGALRADARVISAGKTIMHTEGRVVDAAGVIYAHGTSTVFVKSI